MRSGFTIAQSFAHLAAVVLLVASGATAKGFDKDFVYLFEMDRQDSVIVKVNLLPNRVYLKYVPELRVWGFTLSDSNGRLSKPLKIFDVGSVLAGSQLGSTKNPNLNFALTEDGSWVKTLSVFYQRFLVIDSALSIETTTRLPEQAYQVAKAGAGSGK